MIAPAARQALAQALGAEVRFDVPMARLTSLRVGGPADAVATPSDRSRLALALRSCHALRLTHLVLGGGFNTLALDGPLHGVVIQLSRFRRIEERPGSLLRIEAGVSHSQVTRFCVERGLAGLEFASGIPGSVGGWLAMNAGVPGRELSDLLVELEVMSPTGAGLRHLPAARVHAVYRALHGLAPGSAIVSALLRIQAAPAEAVRAEVARLLERRAATQPLSVPSCGSVFKNPKGDYAGRLIEAAGLKGYRIGGAQFSPMHANFIANLGGARAADVCALIREAQTRVHAASGLHLEPEVRIVGELA